MTEAGRPAPAESIWRASGFVRYWAAQCVSLLGTQFTILAMPLVAAITLRAGPSEMGVLTAVRFLPGLLFGLGIGVWVDRSRRRRLLVGANLLSAAALASVTAAAALGGLGMDQLYVVVFVAGSCAIVLQVAEIPYVVTLVRRTQLVAANVQLQLANTMAALLGPGLAGLLVQASTPATAILIDALSFVVAAGAIMSIRAAESPASSESPARLASDLRDGVVRIWADRLVRSLMLAQVVAQLFSYLVWSIFVLLFVRSLGLTPLQLGVVFTASSLGSVLGARLMRPAVASLGVGPALIGGVLCFALGITARLPAALAGPTFVFPVLVASGVLYGIGLLSSNALLSAVLQSVVPVRLLGRVESSTLTLTWGVQVLAALCGGLLGQTIGLVPTLAIGCLGVPLAVLPVLASPLRRLRALPEAGAVER